MCSFGPVKSKTLPDHEILSPVSHRPTFPYSTKACKLQTCIETANPGPRWHSSAFSSTVSSDRSFVCAPSQKRADTLRTLICQSKSQLIFNLTIHTLKSILFSSLLHNLNFICDQHNALFPICKKTLYQIEAQMTQMRFHFRHVFA